MAATIFNRIGQIGLGVALVGGVVNSALYNGKIYTQPVDTLMENIIYNCCPCKVH